MTDPERVESAAFWSGRLADGPLPPEQEAEFQAWLDRDPANGEALARIVGAWRAVEHYAAAPELVELRGQALASARRANRHRWRRALFPGGAPWAALAATLVIAAVVGGLWLWRTPQVYRTGLGERRVVALADGSRLSLDAATLVRVRYAGDGRKLWLERGRAKFEVAKDPLRPFSVEAGGKVVVATGTAFSVELIRRQVRVVLYEGRVAVLARATPDAKARPEPVGPGRLPAERVLTPGHELIAVASGPAAVVPADPVRTLSWEGGKLVFEDEPLASAVERMNRSAATPITLGDAHVGRVTISGVFKAGDTAAFAEAMSAAFPVRARSTADGVTFTLDPSRKSAGG